MIELDISEIMAHWPNPVYKEIKNNVFTHEGTKRIICIKIC